MAKIVDVTDTPDMPGAGMLHFDDGRPPMLALPEIADEWRGRLGKDALANGVAGPGTGTPDAWYDDPKDPIDRNTGKSLPAPSPEAAPAQAPQAPAAQPNAPAQPGAPSGAPTTQDLVAQANDANERRAADELLNGKLLPGGPGRPAGYVPTTQTTKTEAGAPYDTSLAGMRIDADRKVLDSEISQAATQKNIADADAARAQTANTVAQQQAARAATQLNQKQQAFAQQRQALEDDLKGYSQSAKPDPDRYFKNRNIIANVLGGIGQALGAFGATVGHTQNWAFQFLQSEIQNDIQSQVAEYDAGRADRTNALARLAKYYDGDTDLAKNALGIAMNKVVTTEAQQFAAQSQSKQIAANAQVLSAQFEANSLKREQDMYNASIGKTETTASEKYQQAVAPSGPHRRPLTDAEEAARAKLIKPGKDQGALGLNARAVAMQKRTYGEKKEQIARLYSALDEEAKLQGVAIDRTTGTVVDPNTGRPATELPKSPGIGYVAGHVPDAFAGEEGRALRRARANSARLHAQTIYDKSITAQEAEHEIPTVMGTTPADSLRSLKQRLHELSQYDYELDSTAASIDPRLVNERNQAAKNVNYSRATGSPLEGPAPRVGGDIDSDSDPDADTGGYSR